MHAVLSFARIMTLSAFYYRLPSVSVWGFGWLLAVVLKLQVFGAYRMVNETSWPQMMCTTSTDLSTTPHRGQH
jgi:hypothetical protein